MTRSRLLVLALLLSFGAGSLLVGPVRGSQESARPPGTNYKGPAFTFNKIQEGIYHAVGTGALVVMSNATIVEGDRDVLVVDSHVTPGGAWALREELKAITPKPIRFVVNSHHHFDHAHGNQIYGPEVEIIGTQFARDQIVAGKSVDARPYTTFVGGVPNTIKNLEARLAAAKDAKERETIENQLAVQRNHLEGTKAVRPTPPTVTLTHAMTLYRGAREIRILHLGRGHTGGDVIVHLPKERIIATGDLLVEGTSYLGEGYFEEWVATLDKVKALGFDTVLPGHGRAFTGTAKFDHFQAYLRDFWTQARKLHAARVPPLDAAKQIDLRSHAANYPNIRTIGLTPPDGVFRAYELLDGTIK
jgi:glyoxylase-like metal-dependent hydrolase (beta-lactamase superfamily II)